MPRPAAPVTNIPGIVQTKVRRGVRLLTRSPIEVQDDDEIVAVGNAAATAMTVIMPPSPTIGDVYTIFDTVGSAGTYPITIQGNGNTIDGSATATISTNRGVVTYVYDGEWSSVASAGGGGLSAITNTFATWATGDASPTISQAQASSASNPQNMTFAPQTPGAGAATTATGTPGSYVVALAAPVGAAAIAANAEGSLSMTRGGATIFTAAPLPTFPNIAALWFGNVGASVNRNGSNYHVGFDGSATFLNGVGSCSFRIANTNYLNVTTTLMTLTPDLAIGATPALSGAIRLTNTSGAIKGRNFANTADVPILAIDGSNQVVLGSTANGVILTAATGVDIYAASNVRLRLDGTTGNVNTPALTSFGINGAPDLGGGVGVLAIKTAGTLPNANPVGGGVIYVDAGALKYRGSGGTVTTLGPA